MYCKICGNEIHDGETFCPACGEPVGFEEKNTFTEHYEPQTVGIRASYNDYNGVQSFSDNVEEPRFGEASSYTGIETKKKRSKAPIIIIITAVILIGAGIAAWFFFFNKAPRESIKGRWQPVVTESLAPFSETVRKSELVIDDDAMEIRMNGTSIGRFEYKLEGDTLSVSYTGSDFKELTYSDAGGADLSKGKSPFGDKENKWYVNGDYLVLAKTVYKKIG